MYPTPQVSAQFPTPTVSPGQVYAGPPAPIDMTAIIGQIMPLMMMVLIFAMIIPMMREMVRR